MWRCVQVRDLDAAEQMHLRKAAQHLQEAVSHNTLLT